MAKPRKSQSDGFGYPAVKPKSDGGSGNGGGGEKPIPVVFTQATFIKLIAWTLGPVVVFISAALFFYHKTTVHMGDPNIHLGKSERSKLENKVEARAERKKLRSDIKEHVDIKVREIKVEQKEQLTQVKDDLKHQQKIIYRKILTELRKQR